MGENLALRVDPNCSAHPEVVCEFYVGNNQFQIVHIDVIEHCDASLGFSVLSSPNLLEIIRFEVKGQIYVVLSNEHREKRKNSDILSLLTERELQITTLVASGKVNKQIAKELQISEWTVSTHLRRIFAKLGVSSRAAMVYLCASLIY